jgi:hypothetical protein
MLFATTYKVVMDNKLSMATYVVFEDKKSFATTTLVVVNNFVLFFLFLEKKIILHLFNFPLQLILAWVVA